MENLTKEIQNKIYTKALYLLNSGHNDYCCPAIKFAYMLVLGKDKYESDLDLTIFEEFISFKPKNKTIEEPWFDKDQKQARIKLLTKCIELTNEKTTI